MADRRAERRRPAVGSARAAVKEARRAGPAEHRLQELQKLAGNAAVTMLVQRDGGAAGGTGLSPAQVAKALQFYRVQPHLYTPAVITQLRTRLSLDPSGGIAADLAEAVAQFQRTEGSNDPALSVDGMAGPRSTPRLFPTGLAAPGEGKRFGGDAQTEVFDKWETLGGAQARADALVAEANLRLTAAGVPTLTKAILDSGKSPSELGAFDFPTWTMHLNRLLLDQPGLERKAAADLANTVYHESRHAEQWFMMARLRAGQGRGAAAITSELGIPAEIAKAARDSPIRAGTMEAVVADGFYQSVYGSGGAERNRLFEQLEAADFALTTAKCRCEQQPSSANDALRDTAQARFDELKARYRNLPEENDAHATGPMAEQGVTGGTPHPAAEPKETACERLLKFKRPVPAAAGP